MIVLLQRVSEARVEVEAATIGSIAQGILALVGVQPADDESSARRFLERILQYRLFSDQQGKMNLSLLDIQGGLLLVPQFTLAANTTKGRRASFTSAAPPEQGAVVFEAMLSHARGRYHDVQSGRFGADMQVHLVNDGPVSFILDQA